MNGFEMAYNQHGRLIVDIGYPIYECNKRFVFFKFVNRTNTNVYLVFCVSNLRLAISYIQF